MKQYPLINLPGLDSIEAEKGEVIVNPQGVTFAIGGKPHSRGGTKMIVEPDSVILSQHLKLKKEVVDSLDMGTTATSPADLAKRVPTDKYARIMTSPDKRYDDLAKRTAALMFSKNKAKVDRIYTAQEQTKKHKGMRNDIGNPSSVATFFQSGGATDNTGGPFQDFNALSGLPPVNQILPGFVNPFKPALNINSDPNLGYSYRTDTGQPVSQYRPFANDEYFKVRQEILSKGLSPSKLNAEQKRILGERQQRLSTIPQQFGPGLGNMIEKEFAKYLRAADAIEPDKFLDKFAVMADGTEVPLAGATDAQIEGATGFRYLNKRTGKNTLVDYRDRQNQGFDPILTLPVREDQKLYDLSNLPAKPLGSVSATPAPALNLKTTPAESLPASIKKGVDWQSIINGTEIGLMAADLANVRTKPPYYAYKPSEVAYTRFEPINTKAQERAFNIAAESISNSNLPQQVKNIQLADAFGRFAQGASEVDLANYQQKLANDNRNVQTYVNARNNDINREQAANMDFVQESDRRNYLAAAQRQAYVTNMLDVWRNHVNNRRDIGLINQLSANYDYNLRNQSVEYTPGQGVNPAIGAQGKLSAFNNLTPPTIDPRFLTEEGKRAYGLK